MSPCVGKSHIFDATNEYLHHVAQKMCEDCPIREACLAQAMREISPQGTWGGVRFLPGRVPVVRGRKRAGPQRWREYMSTDVCNLPTCREPLPPSKTSQSFYCCRRHRDKDGVRRRGFLRHPVSA